MVRPLRVICPLDGRYVNKTHSLQTTLSEYGLIRYRVLVEVRYLIDLCQHDALPSCPKLNHQDRHYLEELIRTFNDDDAAEIIAIEKTTNHDVKAVEYFLRQRFVRDKRMAVQQHFIHCGLTSEDTNNLAYALSIKDAINQIVYPNLESILGQLTTFAHQYKDIPILSRTHGQAASPTTVGKEWSNVAARLKRQLGQLREQHYLGKCNGAVGNHNAMAFAFPEVDWLAFSEKFVAQLGLMPNTLTTQIEPHDWLAELLQLLNRINTILLDFARDCWQYIALNIYQLRFNHNEVGSSTMPHKINPIDFENAEGNLGIANALCNHLANKLPVSRLQRDLSDSTVLRNLGIVAGYSLVAYQALTKGINKLSINQETTESELDANWSVLAEAVQTLMKRYHISNAYESLKAFSRGRQLDQATLSAFIDQIDIPSHEKTRLKSLTPAQYIGYAEKLCTEES